MQDQALLPHTESFLLFQESLLSEAANIVPANGRGTYVKDDEDILSVAGIGNVPSCIVPSMRQFI